jgi:hypothetical protein
MTLVVHIHGDSCLDIDVVTGMCLSNLAVERVSLGVILDAS